MWDGKKGRWDMRKGSEKLETKGWVGVGVHNGLGLSGWLNNVCRCVEGRDGERREGKGREGKGRGENGREGKGREGKERKGEKI